ARAGLEAIGLRKVEDPVVAEVPALQAAPEILLGRAGLQAEEGVREVVAGPVELGRKIVALGLALQAQLGRLLLVLVHVGGDRPEVVEELTVDRPALVGVPQRAADHLRAKFGDGVLEGKAAAVLDRVAEALVGGGAFVGGGGRRGEPALVDPAPGCAQGVEVFARQLEPAAGHQEGPRHPGRGQPADSLTGIERRAGPRGRTLLPHPRPPPPPRLPPAPRPGGPAPRSPRAPPPVPRPTPGPRCRGGGSPPGPSPPSGDGTGTAPL